MKKRNWLVTGISSGLGKSIAETVISESDFLIGTFRIKEQAEAFNQTYQNQAKAFVLDVTDQTQIHSVLNEIHTEFGAIDVLVNNAGVGFTGAVEETSSEELRAVFEANFFGALTITQLVTSWMRKEGKGHIIQISSHGGIKSFAGFGIYNASKYALEGVSEALALEVAPLGIHVTIVEPGPFRTEFAGKGLRVASNVISDYHETSGAFTTKLKSVHGKQEGDPKKAAQAIFTLSKNDQPPLRLPLGKIPLTTIQMKIDSLQKDLNEQRSIAESVVF